MEHRRSAARLRGRRVGLVGGGQCIASTAGATYRVRRRIIAAGHGGVLAGGLGLRAVSGIGGTHSSQRWPAHPTVVERFAGRRAGTTGPAAEGQKATPDHVQAAPPPAHRLGGRWSRLCLLGGFGRPQPGPERRRFSSVPLFRCLYVEGFRKAKKAKTKRGEPNGTVSSGPYAVLCAGNGSGHFTEGVQDASAISLDNSCEIRWLGVVLQKRDVAARRVARAVGAPSGARTAVRARDG